MNAPFQEFQREFADYLRQPRDGRRPGNIPARPARLYRELVFNNVCGFLDACFPVTRSLLGENRWRRLNRRFFRDWPLPSPWFRDIPREFTAYLAAQEGPQPWPRWLPELAHYEWLELAVDIMEVPDFTPGTELPLIDCPDVLNPTLQVAAYRWPVHRIGPDYRPRQPQPTCLAVYRNRAQEVRFTELSPLTAALLEKLAAPGMTPRHAIAELAKEIAHPDPQRLLAQATEQLDALQQQEILKGECP